MRNEADIREVSRCYAADFDDRIGSQEPRNAALESIKGEEIDSLLEPPEGRQTC